MKLRKYNRTNSFFRQVGKPTINMNQSGNFCVSQAGADLIGFVQDKENYIEISQDEDSPLDWYLSFTDDTGFKLRKSEKGNKYEFSSKTVALAILKVLPKTTIGTMPASATLLIGKGKVEHDGQVLFPIITKSFQPKK